MKRLLQNHKQTTLASDHVIADVPIVDVDNTAKSAREILKSRHYNFNEAVFITDENKKFVGYVEYPDLLTADNDTKLRELVKHRDPVAWNMDEEHAAGLAVRNAKGWLPVVANDNSLLGAISSHEVQKILRAEHIEDLHILTGIRKEERRTIIALGETHGTRQLWARLPWLIIGLAISAITAYAVSFYEEMLAKNFAVFFFVPAIVYLADAVGTQTEAIVVRGISLSRLSFKQMFWGELRTGAFIGIILGAISALGIVLFMHDWNLAIAVGCAIFTSAFVAAALGLLFPWSLNKLGADPAFGSGPIATVFQDTLTVIIYFFIANWIMG